MSLRTTLLLSLVLLLSRIGNVAGANSTLIPLCHTGCEQDIDCNGTMKCYHNGVSANYSAVAEVCKVDPQKCNSICYSNSSSSGGDPHFSMLDGSKYTFHGQCDLVMARSASYGGIEVHARTEIVGNGAWSLISSAAIRIGNDILEFGNDGSLYYNSIANPQLPVNMSDKYPVTKKVTAVHLTDSGTGEKTTDMKVQVKVGLDRYSRISLSLWKYMISVQVDALFPDTVGMLGTAGKTGLIARDGRVLQDSNEMGLQWQVKDNEPMIFRKVQVPQYPQTCTFPRTTSRRLRTSPDLRLKAIDACKAVDDDLQAFCEEDVMLTGDPHVAMAYINGFSF